MSLPATSGVPDRHRKAPARRRRCCRRPHLPRWSGIRGSGRSPASARAPRAFAVVPAGQIARSKCPQHSHVIACCPSGDIGPGSINSLCSRADFPGARWITVAVELKRRHVVVGASSSRDCQAFAGLRVPDLIEAAAGRADRPRARRIAVAVELKRLHVVVGASAPGDCQALAGLHILDLVGVAAGRRDGPGARRITVAIELQSPQRCCRCCVPRRSSSTCRFEC